MRRGGRRRLADVLLVLMAIGACALALSALRPGAPPTGGTDVSLLSAPAPSPAPTAAPTSSPAATTTPVESASPSASATPSGTASPGRPLLLLVGRDIGTSSFAAATRLLVTGDVYASSASAVSPADLALLGNGPATVVLQEPSDADKLTTEMSALVAADPRARLIVLGPFRTTSQSPLRATATAAGLTYLDPLTDRWLVAPLKGTFSRAQRQKVARRLAAELSRLAG